MSKNISDLEKLADTIDTNIPSSTVLEKPKTTKGKNKVSEMTVSEFEAEIFTDPVPSEEKEEIDDTDDEDETIVGVDYTKVGTVLTDNDPASVISAIIADEARSIKDINIEDYDSITKGILKGMIEYRKELMISEGFSGKEADDAARIRAKKTTKDTANKYVEEHPVSAIITINKKDSDSLLFTEEEKKKLSIVKNIQLVEVELKERPVLKIKHLDDDSQKLNIVKSIMCNTSKYELPMINTFDHMTFSGTSSMKMINVVYTDEQNRNEYQQLSKQIQLIYEQFLGSTTRDKFDIDGNTIMSLTEFTNWFKFHDVNTALYCIYVASSTEMIKSEFGCDSEVCLNEERKKAKVPAKVKIRPYEFTYNCKSLMSFEGISDKFKDDMDVLLGMHNRETIMDGREERRSGKMFESTFTKNWYLMDLPCCAKALNVYSYVTTAVTDLDTYYAAICMLIKEMWIYAGVDENGVKEYIKIDDTDIPKIVSVIKDLTETELKILTSAIQEMMYIPKFHIKTVCPNCGKVYDTNFEIDSLVFLKANGTEEAIV